uniref:Uncharacterized protein n=1 Tax=Streptomyces phage Geonosis TaxID=3158856 RepID=A0AAU7GWW2_9CAUD
MSVSTSVPAHGSTSVVAASARASASIAFRAVTSAADARPVSRRQMGRGGSAITSAGDMARIFIICGTDFGPSSWFRNRAKPGMGSSFAFHPFSMASFPKTTCVSVDVASASDSRCTSCPAICESSPCPSPDSAGFCVHHTRMISAARYLRAMVRIRSMMSE